MDEVAALITAISTPIVLLAIAWLNHRVGRIDHAVNGKKPGAQSMVSQVDDLHSDRPPPPELPPELDNAAIMDLLRYVAAEMHEQRNEKG